MEWAAANKEYAQSLGGDGFLVLDCTSNWLVCMVDALGHGAEAAFVKEAALRTAAQNADRRIEEIFAAVHLALYRTRGAAICLARISKTDGSVTMASIGNVESVLIGRNARKYVVGKGGVVGYKMPGIRATNYPLESGDVLVMFTDGVDSAFLSATDWAQPVSAIANQIIEQHASTIDDALVLIGRRE